MDQAVGTPRGFDPATLASYVLDLMLLCAWYWVVPPLASFLATPHWTHALIIAAAYLAMCGGLSLAKRVAPTVKADDDSVKAEDDKESPGQSTDCALGLAIPFSLFVITITIVSSGLLEEATPWLKAAKELPGGDAILSVAGLLGFFLFLGLFPAVLLSSPKPTIPAGTPRAFTARVTALILGNSMVLVTAAYWQGHLTGAEPMGIALGGRILVFVLVYAVFLMFYLPPGLAVAVIEGSNNSVWSLLIALAVLIWPLTA